MSNDLNGLSSLAQTDRNLFNTEVLLLNPELKKNLLFCRNPIHKDKLKLANTDAEMQNDTV